MMIKKAFIPISVLCIGLALSVNALAGGEIAEKKKTSLGLYVNSQKAYQMWKANPERVSIIDCRTPEEYTFIGHAPMAYNIPAKFVSHEYDSKKKTYKMKDNPAFVAEVKKRFKKNETLMLMCRSGSRSAKAVNLLAAAGYQNVYNIYDGFEGDKVKDKGSYFKGQRKVNGWKNSGNPWTYKGDEALMYLPISR